MSNVICRQAIRDRARGHHEVDGVPLKPCENDCIQRV